MIWHMKKKLKDDKIFKKIQFYKLFFYKTNCNKKNINQIWKKNKLKNYLKNLKVPI